MGLQLYNKAKEELLVIYKKLLLLITPYISIVDRLLGFIILIIIE